MAIDVKCNLTVDDKASGPLAQFEQTAKKAATGIEGAFANLRGKFDLLSGAIGGLATLAGGMAFKSIINSTVNWNLETAKLARTLGMTLEQASTYKVALHGYGIEQDVAEKAGLRLAKTLGSNEDVFRKLGVATRDSSGHLRATSELMPEVNQRLSEMKAGTDRNVIAMEIYGRSWGEVQSLLKLTPAAMKEAEEAAKRLHLIVGEEGVAQSKEYKKNLNDLELVGKSLGITFGSVLLSHLVKFGAYIGDNAPVLVTAFSNSLQFVIKLAQTAGEWLGLMGFRIYSLGAIAKDVFSGQWSEMKNDWKSMVSAGEDFSKDITAKWSTWGEPNKKNRAPTGNQIEPDLLGLTGSDGKSALAKTKTEYFSAWGDIQKFSKKVADSMISDQKAIADAQKKTDETADWRRKEILAFSQKVADSMIAERKAIEEHMEVLDKINHILYDRSVFGGAMNAITQYMEEAANLGTQIEDSLGNSLRNMEDSIVQFCISGKMNWRSMVQSMMADLARMAVAKPLTSALGGLLGEGLTALFGWATSGSSSFGSAATFGSGFTNPNPYPVKYSLATGTNYVPTDGLAMLHKGEAVIPAAFNSSGKAPNITVVVKNETGEKIEAESNKVKFDYENLIVEVVAKKAKSSPGFRQVLAGAH
jgi:hypothetical protein